MRTKAEDKVLKVRVGPVRGLSLAGILDQCDTVENLEEDVEKLERE